MPQLPRRTGRKARSLAGIVTAGATLLAIAGCGGSSHSSDVTTQKGRPTQGQSNADIGSAAAQITPAAGGTRGSRHPSRRSHRPSGNAVIGPAGRVQRARETPGSSDDDVSTRTPGLKPCTLVKLAEARSITRGAITGVSEAPLGPTCIYKLGRSKTNITLVVETLRFSQIAHQMAKPAKLTVAGHKAYCGRLGLQMMFVQLTRDRTLNVTASCPVAKRFAAVALQRLP